MFFFYDHFKEDFSNFEEILSKIVQKFGENLKILLMKIQKNLNELRKIEKIFVNEEKNSEKIRRKFGDVRRVFRKIVLKILGMNKNILT